jgi:glucokinase
VGKEDGRATLGIDIGGTKSLYALFDERFEIVAQEKLRTHPDKGGVKAFTRGMRGAVEALLRVARKKGLRVRAVGVGCAGDIDMREGVVRSAPNVAFLKDYPFRARLEKLTGAKVFVGNDVQAGLYGEFRLGAARKARHVIGIFLGTGVGGALIIDGRIHRGATGLAGDIGNYVLHAAPPAEDSRREVLDMVASRPAIAGGAAALASKRWAPNLREVAGTDVMDIKSNDLAESIRRGDKAVERLVRSRIAVVGAAISNFVDFINPDMVVLGGGLVEAMPALVRREVRKAIEGHAAPKAARAVHVVVARLHDHAVTAGAAKLALDMLSPQPPIVFRRL